MRAFRRDEGGQSVVLIAVSLPLILSLLLLVIDGGRLYVERERIRNAAQLAAEAAVSLAADSPGRSQPKDGDVRGIVAEALQRNLPGGLVICATAAGSRCIAEALRHPDVRYVANVVMPFRTDIPEFNVKVSVTKEFRASIAALRFTISAEAAARLGEPQGTGSAAGAAAAGGQTKGEVCGQASTSAGVITVPGEIAQLSATGRQSFAGPTGRSGAHCQAELYLADGGGTATYRFEATAAGERMLWIRAHDDGVHAARTRSVSVVVNGRALGWSNEGRAVGWKWYNLGSFSLVHGGNQISITKTAGTSAAFVMDELVLAPEGFVPQ